MEVSQKSLHGLNKLENAYKSANRWEFERWILVVTLLSIMFAVLFIGVLAICKKSRGAIVAFSGLGIVVFVLAWTIFSVLFPISVVSTCFINLYKLSSGVRWLLRNWTRIYFTSFPGRHLQYVELFWEVCAGQVCWHVWRITTQQDRRIVGINASRRQRPACLDKGAFWRKHIGNFLLTFIWSFSWFLGQGSGQRNFVYDLRRLQKVGHYFSPRQLHSESSTCPGNC